jgi:hypothetical protein
LGRFPERSIIRPASLQQATMARGTVATSLGTRGIDEMLVDIQLDVFDDDCLLMHRRYPGKSSNLAGPK